MVVADTAAVADMVAAIATKLLHQAPKPVFFGLPSGFPPGAEAESFSPPIQTSSGRPKLGAQLVTFPNHVAEIL